MESRAEFIKRKAQAVKELKAQYYIGTQDAKKYLDTFDLVDSEPKKWAEIVNSYLPEDAEYKATPERIIGLTSTIDDSLLEIEVDGGNYTFLYSGRWHPIHFTNMADYAFYGMHEIGQFERLKDKKPYVEKWFADFLTETFADFNKNKDKSDYALAEIGFDRLCAQLKAVTYKPHEEFDSFVNDLKQRMAVSFGNVRFNTTLLREKERKQLKISKDIRFDWHKILMNIQRDRVDTRFEYRRQVAMLFAEQHNRENGNDAVKYARFHVFDLGERDSIYANVLPILVSELKFLNRILKE